ncbi:MAG: mobile mystery protein A [Candidatus Marinimicrobia bacterium]|jgi:predicted DNA-binding mobile mystery protein A|nr:mobile mystery protein A [Candidatus Neomarinimicrobiota bacterium]MBT4852832.1 mobile mystery protein A [Candidatus Neomarinimicrobiota bacterium]MBT6217649.1 mobile mystery protein A [Candidatus Neomarinimicrobiota bacterium]
MDKQRLIIDQLDRKFEKLKQLDDLVIPPSGWIHSIRTALKMSLRQLGNNLGITAQSVKEMEEREKNYSITLKGLREVGYAMNMKFFYGFIPDNTTLSDMIEQRALKIAREIVLRTSISMKLENQENLPEQIQISIDEKKDELIRKQPRYLWD